VSYTYLNCENSTSSQGPGEVSSAASFADIPASVLSRSNPIAGKSCCNVSGTECCRCSRSGTTSEPSTATRGEGESMSSAEDSHVRTSASLARGPESTVNAPDSGERCRGSLAKYDPVSRSWRTRQRSLLGGLVEFSETWPRWGTMRDGVSSVRNVPGCITRGNESGFAHPTITKTNISDVEIPENRLRISPAGWITKQSKKGTWGSINWFQWALLVGLIPFPTLAEYSMGWPVGWTDLQPLETAKFRQWLTSHGVS
jgi:hypothetical protein